MASSSLTSFLSFSLLRNEESGVDSVFPFYDRNNIDPYTLAVASRSDAIEASRVYVAELLNTSNRRECLLGITRMHLNARARK